jgi:hypothetical protein
MRNQIKKIVNSTPLLRGLKDGTRAFARANREAHDKELIESKRKEEAIRQQFEQIPARDLDSLIGDAKCRIKLRIMRYEDGMMPHRDAVGLLALLVAENPGQVLEIGTYMGHTTLSMAENLENAVIHTVDLPPDFVMSKQAVKGPPKDDFHLIARRIVGREFKGQQVEKRIVQHFGDTAQMDFSQIGKPTFFFIDGSHTYEYCKNDSEKCFALCPRGGTFLWHDCNMTHPGVLKFLLEWRNLGRDIVRIEGTDLAFWKG